MTGPTGPRRCALDGRQRTRAAVVAKLARDLAFPDWAGSNLDAVYDVLRTDVPGPFTVVWRPTAASLRALGEDFTKLRGLLEEVAAQRADVTVLIEPEGAGT